MKRDPLAEIIGLLRPGAPYSKLVNANGEWRVRRTEVGQVYYCMTLAGTACLEVDRNPPITLCKGDFVLIPAAYNFTMSSVDPVPTGRVETVPVIQHDGTVRLGGDGPTEVQQLVGYCTFGSADASLLVSLLPDLVVVRGEARLGVLASLVRDEARGERPARDVLLEHLLQVLLIEALRSTADAEPSPGLLCGLADHRLALALRAIHAEPARSWTVAELAKEAGMSRSAFFNRFRDKVGLAPIEYLLNWRMSVAKDLLCRERASVAEVAARVGYGSASAFNTAFARQVGRPPARYVQYATSVVQ